MTRRVVGFDFPALISIEFQRYGFGTQTHLEKMVILEKIYSYLRAYLFVIMDKEKYQDKIEKLMHRVDADIKFMNQQYDPAFESMLTCNPSEKDFNLIMRNVHISLAEITAESHILDRAEMTTEGYVVG